jgi:hypothetical protein
MADEAPPSPSSSTASLPSDVSSFRAPLDQSFDDISLDGTSVQGGDDAAGPASPSDVSDEQRASALQLKSEANALFGRASDSLVAR